MGMGRVLGILGIVNVKQEWDTGTMGDCGMGMRHTHREGMKQLTIGNEDGYGECGEDDEGCDEHKSLPWNGLLHVQLQRLAGEEEGVDAHPTREDHQRKTDYHRQ